jgi:hypothetical protein
MKKILFSLAILGIFTATSFAATATTPEVTANSLTTPDKDIAEKQAPKHKMKKEEHKKKREEHKKMKHEKRTKKEHKPGEPKAEETPTTTDAPPAPAPVK